MADTIDFRDRILNCDPSAEPESDWTSEDAADADAIAAPPKIPDEKDLREDWWEINDQERTGSCVGWATADSALRWHFVKAGRLTATPTDLLSPRFIWMASKETDQFVSRPTTFIENSGTKIKAALDVARKFGAVKENVLPFKPSNLYPGDTRAFYIIASRFKIQSYYRLKNDLAVWREWLATNGPIMTRLNVDDTWYEATQNNGKMKTYKSQTAGGGHAVALVGYTKEGFIVRNSWGTDWGDEGFGYASDSYAEDAFTEAFAAMV